MGNDRIFKGTYDGDPAHPATAPPKLTEKVFEVIYNNGKGFSGSTKCALERWFKQPGDRVERGEPLALVVYTVPDDEGPEEDIGIFVSPFEGTLDDVAFAEGDLGFLVDAPIARLRYDLVDGINHDPLSRPIADENDEPWTPVSLQDFVLFSKRDKPGRNSKAEYAAEADRKSEKGQRREALKAENDKLRNQVQDYYNYMNKNKEKLRQAEDTDIPELEAKKEAFLNEELSNVACGLGLLALEILLGSVAVVGLLSGIAAGFNPARLALGVVAGVLLAILIFSMVQVNESMKKVGAHGPRAFAQFRWNHFHKAEESKLGELRSECKKWRKSIDSDQNQVNALYEYIKANDKTIRELGG